ncbi:UNVERIFIED_CONTAM: hypothetical protein GTU68_003428 [Idotea baltica]|nr:hypothetical protein [Idotea baltica]
MSTSSFLFAFQRFCNLYTIPSYLYSDNAKGFIKAGCLLSESLNSSEFSDELNRNIIKHFRIPIYSAWVGATWERLIRVLKTCLYKVIGRNQLTYFELLIVLSKVQNAINSRPLTYRSNSDELEAITPNSFLKLNSNTNLIVKQSDDLEINLDKDTLERTLSVHEEIYEHFRNLWYKDYLLSLREHSKNLHQSNWENRIKVGDIVLIKLLNKPRPFWLLGRGLEIIISYDNKIRSVKIKQGNGLTANHSIKNLYPLELSITH